jgi:alkanesulfonate monooxygenase SsuD/methylene tetrahydromethanopterin reductase-like flavin-dependent oxidoreductase (luciferase family)
MLRLAGEVADGVILNWIPPDRVPWAVARVHQGCRRANRDPGSVKVVCYVRTAVTDNAEVGWQVLRRLAATYAAMPSYARMFEEAGHGHAVAAMRAAWQAGGVDAAASVMPEEFVRGLGVVGTAADCLRALRRYRGAGVDVVAAYPFPVGADAVTSMRATIQGLAASSGPYL